MKDVNMNRRLSKITHGMFGTSIYSTWDSMLQRCKNPNNKSFPQYGGRGITVCARWGDFSNFYKDMGDKPSADYSIDRIDNDLGYSKANCRWVDRSTQQHNRKPYGRLGIRGIYCNNGSYTAEISRKGKRIYLGTFKDILLAKAAYENASKEIYADE